MKPKRISHLGNRCMLYGMSKRGPLCFFADLGHHQRHLAGTIIAYGRIPKRMGRPSHWDVRQLWKWAKAHPISPLNGRVSSGLGLCRCRLRRLALRR
jgi:hypothetical protein